MRGLFASRPRSGRLPCPGCDYDLRGASSDEAMCPECGAWVDLSLSREQSPAGWGGCPYYRMLWDPVAVAVCCAVLAPVLLLVPVLLMSMFSWSGDQPHGPLLYGIAVMATLLLVWGGSLVHVARRYGSAEGALLSLLCHVLIAGFIAGIMLGGLAFASFVYALIQDQWAAALRLAFGVLVCGGFLLAMDCMDRWIGRRSQRQHLRMQSMSKAGA